MIMNIKLNTLNLVCKQGIEKVDFGQQLTFVHGPMAKGKSSVARLVDFCLGGKLERTPAIARELLSVSLAAEVGNNKVLFERVVNQNSSITVSWYDSEGVASSLLAPLVAADEPIWGETVFNLSDLILFLMGHEVKKVRKRTSDPDSQTVRLSFRDFFHFSYLDQDHLDSDFYRLDTPIVKEKSKDVINYVTGFFSETLLRLNDEIITLRNLQRAKRESAESLKRFLKEFGFASLADIEMELEGLNDQAGQLEQKLLKIKNETSPARHIRQDIRERLDDLEKTVNDGLDSRNVILLRIEEQEQLISELVAMKFKASRSNIAEALLSSTKFDVCPACSNNLENKNHKIDACYLCDLPLHMSVDSSKVENINSDIDSRIEDLKNSISRHKANLKRVKVNLTTALEEKASLDFSVSQSIRDYETNFLSRTISYEKDISRISERSRYLNNVKRMPEAIQELEAEADGLSGDIEGKVREFRAEEDKLKFADANFQSIETTFKAILIGIKFPGVTDRDMVVINRRTLIIEIWPNGIEEEAYTFFDLGSGGKKVMFNICFALALHVVAAAQNLPLPTLLIIDSPTKNITPDINKEIVDSFYKVVYEAMNGSAGGVLSNTQIVIIDQKLVTPDYELDLVVRKMPPALISYYDGP